MNINFESIEKLEKLIEIIVIKVLKNQPAPVEPKSEISPRMIKALDVCSELNISRQTLYNWLNNPKTKHMLTYFIKREGKYVYYDIEKVKNAIQKNAIYFGGSRDYSSTQNKDLSMKK